MKADERKAHPEFGDAYTYIALDPISKVIVAFHVGKRDSANTHRFIEDLSRRIDGSTQVSTDAWGPYSPAISRFFGNRATYAQITKFYAAQILMLADMLPRVSPEHRSPRFLDSRLQ